MGKEKNRVALISVFAAIFLTAFKLTIGAVIRSLGLFSESLGKRATNVLLDRVPEDSLAKVEEVLKSIHGITRYHDLRIRESGADTFVDIKIHVKADLTIQQVHKICNQVEDEVRKVIKRSDVFVHAEPEGKHTF
jgi:divalent metal cation (Fe/Co/Zn/Cd) transporter